MSPERIQRKRTKGWRMPAGAVYVGRPTMWGNPFYVRFFGAEQAVSTFKEWAMSQGDYVRFARQQLRGRDLACWCPLDAPCHADVLLEIAKSEEEGTGRMTPYYDQDGITIYHGEAMTILESLPSASVDVLMTDPPYSSGGMFRSDRLADPAVKYRGWSQNDDGSRRPPTANYGTFGGDNKDQWAWIRWVTAWSMQCLRVVRVGGHGFMFTDWRQLPAATDAAQFGGWSWRGLLVWDKGVGRPIRGQFRNHLEYIVWMVNGAIDAMEDYPSTLIAVPTVGPGARLHVTQKPVPLMHQLFRVLPTQDALTVLDPFMGSGSILVAAAQAGHKAIGVEIDERYCEIAVQRLAQGVLAL